MKKGSNGVLISPSRLPENMFVNNFTKCLTMKGFLVGEFYWKRFPVAKTIILHWPNEFFLKRGFSHLIKCLCKISAMRLYRAAFGIRFVWVAHNLEPHDTSRRSILIRDAFLNSLDGVILLSKFSRRAIERLYKLPANISILETVHGDYRASSISQPQSRSVPGATVQLVTFGQIRPYKNIDTLVGFVKRMKDEDFHLSVVGYTQDGALTNTLREIADDSLKITLDIRSEVVPELELERYIDSADGVILPYRAILNSGSVFLALSRNRPVLAPRMGSLPEICDVVGSDWLVLFDGEISEDAIKMFTDKIRQRASSQVCDLSRFSWDRIGEELSQFIVNLHH